MDYIFLPGADLNDLELCGVYRDWMEDWLYTLNENIEQECISSAECVQGLLCETLLGEVATDWRQVENTLLRDGEGNPLAYSEAYGKRLFKFEAQWKQTPVYAVYNSFWICRHCGGTDRSDYQALIQKFIQPDGWIYNPEVSNTQIRTRMKSELLMSLAMGTEILLPDQMSAGQIHRFEAALASLPLTGYVSAEFFRLKALENIQRTCQFPEGIGEMLEKCEAKEGYNDFCVSDKMDDYMGTRKRTRHDAAIHTPLISNMARALSLSGENALAEAVAGRMRAYAERLRRNPMDIPAFRMRDIAYPFGAGVTPLEVIAASIITNT